MKFKVVSDFEPSGDQPQAIEKLTNNLKNGVKNQVLLGVTGSGKTYTMAKTIEKIQKPTLIISHNKTLAGQLYQEFREFFPHNAVSYFVSYYDYYQPEAYIPSSDTYIEKESQINDEIDKLRLAATANLLTRPDVIVVASVSCIYNLGSPVEYGKFVLEIRRGVKIAQNDILIRLTDLQYERNDFGFKRGSFRVRGESIELLPAYLSTGLRISIKNNFIDEIQEFDPLTGDVISDIDATVIYPAKHYMTDPRSYDNVFTQIKNDTQKQVEYFKSKNKLIEAQRIEQKTSFDLQMIKEVGYVNGIENYSSYFDGRKKGEAPYTLLDYMQAASKDWLLFVDESHITIPQIRGMYNGDRSRKEVLINYGFRLPSALDNRPLKFDEFARKINQTIYVSATPNDFEVSLAKEEGDAITEQIIRPTGIIDPEVFVKPSKNQINDLINEINNRASKNERVLVVTLTKKMSEELTFYLQEKNIKVAYLHSDIDTLKRQDVLDDLRRGDVDVIIGINLLREGLDLPEVTLVAILDADKEGFLRSTTSLIQTMGRAARNINSKIILYADKVTDSIKNAIKEVERRRKIQLAYNKTHNITPINIKKSIREKLVEAEETPQEDLIFKDLADKEILLPDEKKKMIKMLKNRMNIAVKNLDFENAAIIRDKIKSLS